MEEPNCSAAKAEESDGETFYICSDRDSPCFRSPCNPNMCVPEDDDFENCDDCIFKNYYGLCDNDDSYTQGEYCPGHCDFYESK